MNRNKKATKENIVQAVDDMRIVSQWTHKGEYPVKKYTRTASIKFFEQLPKITGYKPCMPAVFLRGVYSRPDGYPSLEGSSHVVFLWALNGEHGVSVEIRDQDNAHLIVRFPKDVDASMVMQQMDFRPRHLSKLAMYEDSSDSTLFFRAFHMVNVFSDRKAVQEGSGGSHD